MMGSNRAVHTHNMHLKMYTKFSGDISEISLTTGETFQQKSCLLSEEMLSSSSRNYRWSHLTKVAEREKRWLGTRSHAMSKMHVPGRALNTSQRE
jgi:hypothetical protein